ncbi:YncE family protein [Psychroserpens sp. AS72]|uniref:YncE family protein n=1 Tax=Psychroserpens sp. AS72 TaxID=3135775 RepID=UPI003173D565
MKKVFLSIIAMSLLVVSCSNDDDFNPEPLGAYENGILVSGEGGPAGSVSFISSDFTTTENQIYFNVNNEALGVYLQSIGFNGDLAYIITDTANSITVVDRYTFEKVTTITTGLSAPRYISFANGKAYVSNWGDPNVATDDFIAVLDLTSNTVESTVLVGEGPEQLISNNETLFVSHKGGYNTNNIISAMDLSTNTVETITVNDVPDEMAFDAAGNLVVLSTGANIVWADPPLETEGAITRINVNDNTVTSSLEFPVGAHPELMTYSNGMTYYVLNNSVYGLADADTTLPSTPVFDITANYAYGMAINNGLLYVTDASFTEQSELLIYDLSSGSELNSFNVGLGASKIYFN